MTLRPGIRRFVLTAHVVSSVGWLGAIGVFLALAVAGMTVEDERKVRAAYLAMELAAWSVLVPLALAALVTGLVQSLGTKWGLFRHYWVLAKLLITIVATVVLLLYTQTIGSIADVAAQPRDLEDLRNPSPAVHAAVGVLLLLVTTVLWVYKPRGLTPYGWRKQQEIPTASRP
jgi:NADH:ubiquinone oxidoreductase subunit 6 (subunit J)